MSDDDEYSDHDSEADGGLPVAGGGEDEGEGEGDGVAAGGGSAETETCAEAVGAGAAGAEAEAEGVGVGAVAAAKQWVQCDSCEKWRVVHDSVDIATLPSTWYCHMNTWDPAQANCEAPEQVEQEDVVWPGIPSTFVAADDRARCDFWNQLTKYLFPNAGTPHFPHIQQQPVDMYTLFTEVQSQGGYDKFVSRGSGWISMLRKLSIPISDDNITLIKQLYNTYLLNFERQTPNPEPPQPFPPPSSSASGSGSSAGVVAALSSCSVGADGVSWSSLTPQQVATKWKRGMGQTRKRPWTSDEEHALKQGALSAPVSGTGSIWSRVYNGPYGDALAEHDMEDCRQHWRRLKKHRQADPRCTSSEPEFAPTPIAAMDFDSDDEEHFPWDLCDRGTGPTFGGVDLLTNPDIVDYVEHKQDTLQLIDQVCCSLTELSHYLQYELRMSLPEAARVIHQARKAPDLLQRRHILSKHIYAQLCRSGSSPGSVRGDALACVSRFSDTLERHAQSRRKPTVVPPPPEGGGEQAGGDGGGGGAGYGGTMEGYQANQQARAAHAVATAAANSGLASQILPSRTRSSASQMGGGGHGSGRSSRSNPNLFTNPNSRSSRRDRDNEGDLDGFVVPDDEIDFVEDDEHSDSADSDFSDDED